MKEQVTLGNTIGAVFLGASASCLLFGIIIVQTHLYYHNFPKDWAFQRVSVAVLMTLSAFHLILTLHAVYFYLVVNFGNLAALESIVWSFRLQLVISTFTSLLVQSLYAMRVWKLGRQFSRFWPGLVASIVAGGWTIAIFATAKFYNKTHFTDLGSMRKVIYAAPATATGIDMIIAIAMCCYLNWSRSSFSGTNGKIIIIIRYVLITGCLTSACSLSTLIVYATMPHSLAFAGIGLLLPYLYINSYIAMLNARKYMNERGTVDINKISGLSLQTDEENLRSASDKAVPDSFRLSMPKFASSPKWAGGPRGGSEASEV